MIERGERILRVHSTLTAGSRRQARGRGKSDSIDALAVARAALREGLDTLPAAHLDGPELDVRLLVDHRERLVRARVAVNNTLQRLRGLGDSHTEPDASRSLRGLTSVPRSPTPPGKESGTKPARRALSLVVRKLE